jgi:hypothetical protein
MPPAARRARLCIVTRREMQGANVMRKLFSLTTVASGAAVGMIVAGALALVGGAYDHKVVHDQLAPQKIFFAADASALPPDIRQYAGQQVDTASEAKVFADKYIAVHLQEVAGGKTYSQVSAQFLKDPTNAKLAEQRQTLFMGETLRGMLLNAWGWGMVGTIATIAGVALIGIGGVLLAIPVVAALAERRRRPATGKVRAEATPAH